MYLDSTYDTSLEVQQQYGSKSIDSFFHSICRGRSEDFRRSVMLSRIASSNKRSKPIVVLQTAENMPGRSRNNTRGIPTIDEEKPLADQVGGRNNRKKLPKRPVPNSRTSKPGAPSLSSARTRTGEPRPPRKVHWYHKVEKKRHHRLQDLSPDEKESVWYTENDTKIILAMAKVTVKMMMKGEHCDDVDYCSRGLEGKTPVGSKRRQKNKLRVRKALLEEQEIQREEGVNDPEYLAQVSIKYSADVVQQAHDTALEDERVIQEYLSIRDDDCLPIPPTRMKR